MDTNIHLLHSTPLSMYALHNLPSVSVQQDINNIRNVFIIHPFIFHPLSAYLFTCRSVDYNVRLAICWSSFRVPHTYHFFLMNYMYFKMVMFCCIILDIHHHNFITHILFVFVFIDINLFCEKDYYNQHCHTSLFKCVNN